MSKYYVKSDELEAIYDANSPKEAALRAVKECPPNVAMGIEVYVDEAGFRPRLIEKGEHIGPNEVVMNTSAGSFLVPADTFKVCDLFALMGISTEPDDVHLAEDDDDEWTLDV